MRWRFSPALVRSHSVPACGDGAFLPLSPEDTLRERDGQSPAFGDRHSSFLDDAGIRFLE